MLTNDTDFLTKTTKFDIVYQETTKLYAGGSIKQKHPFFAEATKDKHGGSAPSVVVMDEKQKQIADLKTYINNLESELEATKRALFELSEPSEGQNTVQPDIQPERNNENVIEGTFNGENMVGPQGKIFPVPANYASKSKLVEGDRLKLTIDSNGSFVFKQIGPVQRKKLIGNLIFDNNTYVVEVGDSRYNVLYASVTYHKAKPGDKVAIELPAQDGARWCVLEGIIHDVATTDKPEPAVVLGGDFDTEAEAIEEKPVPNIPNENTVNESISPTTDDNLEKVRDTLGINDLEITGPKGAPTPEAVNPQTVAENATPTQMPGSTTVDPRADAIQELEI